MKALARGFLRMVHAEGVFAAQAKFPRRAFPPKLFGLDVLIDADAKPWLIEAQRKPAMAGTPMVSRIAGEAMTTIFEMASGFIVDDAMPAERIASLAKDRATAMRREAEHEAAFRGQFELLLTARFRPLAENAARECRHGKLTQVCTSCLIVRHRPGGRPDAVGLAGARVGAWRQCPGWDMVELSSWTKRPRRMRRPRPRRARPSIPD